MTGGSWVSLIALLAWLVLALSAVRAHRIGAGQAVRLGLTWAAIFALVTAVFTWVR